MGDVLDEYLSKPRSSGDSLTPDNVYQNSGHKLLCPTCKKFQRTSIDLIVKGGPILRVRCKVCGTSEDFVPTKDGWIPKWFDEQIRTFARKRTISILGGKINGGDGIANSR